MKTPLIWLACVVVLSTSEAATLALDEASNAPYGSGWETGDNGGSGFSGWTLTPSSAGASFSTANVLWTLRADSGSTATATWSFTGGSVTIDQKFEVDYYTGTLTAGASSGIRLENTSGELLWGLSYVGGNAPYTITDSSGTGKKSATVTNTGVHIEFSLSSATAYSVTVTPFDGSAASTRTGELISASGGIGISQFQFFYSGNTGSTVSNQQSFNNLAVVPEPSALLLVAFGGLLFARRALVKRR